MNQVIPIFTFGIGLILKRKGQFIIRVFLPEIIINIKLSGQIDLSGIERQVVFVVRLLPEDLTRPQAEIRHKDRSRAISPNPKLWSTASRLRIRLIR